MIAAGTHTRPSDPGSNPARWRYRLAGVVTRPGIPALTARRSRDPSADSICGYRLRPKRHESATTCAVRTAVRGTGLGGTRRLSPAP